MYKKQAISVSLMGRGIPRRRLALFVASLLLLCLPLFALDRAYPPDTAALRDLSVQIDDRHGRPLAAFLNHGDKFRLPTAAEEVSPLFVKLLLAYEDRRFYSHPGVDPLAALRAVGQNLAAGRVVSGASTLTMQAARLLHPGPRGWRAKLSQTLRALQLEARYDKRTILSFYLTLAPYGGNVEGVRAAAWTWFGKGAEALSPGEAALLAALPRAPEALRPDRADPADLKAARDMVIDRAEALGALNPSLAAEARAEPLPNLRRPPPMAAPHAARRLAATVKGGEAVRAALDPALQAATEKLLRDAMAEQGRHVGAAALIVENRSRKVRAYVGAPDAADAERLGAVDMVQAARSPGSTLKPFVYGAAFTLGLLHPETLVAVVSTRVGAYAPQNFDRGFHGDLTVAEALQRSLNVPAVLALQKVGPQRFVDGAQAAGARLILPKGDAAPGLPVALGGVGVSLWDMTQLYAALADGGRPARLTLREDAEDANAAPLKQAPLLSAQAARAVLRILEGAPPPDGRTFGAQSALAGGGAEDRHQLRLSRRLGVRRFRHPHGGGVGRPGGRHADAGALWRRRRRPVGLWIVRLAAGPGIAAVRRRRPAGLGGRPRRHAAPRISRSRRRPGLARPVAAGVPHPRHCRRTARRRAFDAGGARRQAAAALAGGRPALAARRRLGAHRPVEPRRAGRGASDGGGRFRRRGVGAGGGGGGAMMQDAPRRRYPPKRTAADPSPRQLQLPTT